jgi:hypothetical protein
MTEAPVKLRDGHTIPLISNRQIAAMFDHEDIEQINDVYRRR